MFLRNGACLVLLASIVANADAQPADPTEPAVQPPAIADGPLTVDPATLMPGPLAAVGAVEFQGESLLEFSQWFSDAHQLTVVYDKGALSDLAISLGEPVYDELRGEPLYLLLGRLKMMELDWYYEDGIVTITTAEDAETRLTTAPYNLGDLLDAGFTTDAIADAITATIAAETWAQNGGGEADLQWLGDVMFVSQTAEIHRQVAGLLAALRQHGRRTFSFDPPQHQTLREKLTQPVSLKLEQTPLVVAIEKLAEASGADIRLDGPSASDLGVRQRAPVTLNLENRSLGTVLQVMVRDLELTWMLRDGVLWITSEETAELQLKTAVYDVRDLSRDASEAAALTDAVLSQVAATTWAESGGGEAEIYFAKPGVMVVSQTEENHQQLLSLLERYRQALRQSKPRDKKQADPNEMLTRYYRLQREMAEDLAGVLPTLVAADSWAADGVNLVVVKSVGEVQNVRNAEAATIPYSVLIITQTRQTHDEIATLIGKIRNGDAPTLLPEHKSGFGGGGGFGGGYFSLPQRPAGESATTNRRR